MLDESFRANLSQPDFTEIKRAQFRSISYSKNPTIAFIDNSEPSILPTRVRYEGIFLEPQYAQTSSHTKPLNTTHETPYIATNP